jgi:ubiquinone/menaquinone biosynthesis C-methylase UbiE
MAAIDTDIVKQQVAAHWNRRAAHFDEDFGHSNRTEAERAAWDHIFARALPAGGPLDALDCGCGTGFLSLQLAERGHRVTGVDFAPAMLEAARAKAAERGFAVRFEQGDVEQLPFAPQSFDLALCRHLLWTLPHPEAAVALWVRLLRPGGRLIAVESQAIEVDPAEPRDNARKSPEYAAIGDRLPFRDGRAQAEIEALFRAQGLVEVRGEPLTELIEAQQQRMLAEGMEPMPRRRYVVWGDKR